MNSLTSKSSPGVVDERSAPAVAGARREAASPGVGRAADPEVAEVAKRRRYSDEYKLRILAEVEANPGKSGVILRREGLYSSNLSQWRRWKDKMSKEKPPRKGQKQNPNELAKLKRENARLKMKLQQAEGLIELQKKASELLSMMSKSENDESS